jgi:hypothetical protein
MEFFTPEQIERLSRTTVRCDFLVKFDFASGPDFAWNGNTALPALDGNTYKPMYGFGQIDGLGLAGPGTTSEAITMSLDGLPNMPLDFLGKALAETSEVEQRMLTVSLQLFDDDWQCVAVPVPLFFGFMQPPKVSRSPMQGTEGAVQSVSLTAENMFYGRSRPPYGRNTDRDQQARSPGDKFFGFVSSLVQKTITYPDY